MYFLHNQKTKQKNNNIIMKIQEGKTDFGAFKSSFIQ